MLSDTLKNEFARYAIGEKVRSLRWQRKLRLVELAEITGLSPALLSKIERGNSVPSLPALTAIANAFEVKLSYFFPKPLRWAPAVTRKTERVRLPESADSTDPSYEFESLNFPVSQPRLNCYRAEFKACEKLHYHMHEGMEFIYVVCGQLLIAIMNEEILLAEGDSICFDSGVPHAYQKLSSGPCISLVVSEPASGGVSDLEIGRTTDKVRFRTRELIWRRAS